MGLSLPDWGPSIFREFETPHVLVLGPVHYDAALQMGERLRILSRNLAAFLVFPIQME